jgi:hypothetical protein
MEMLDDVLNGYKKEGIENSKSDDFISMKY